MADKDLFTDVEFLKNRLSENQEGNVLNIFGKDLFDKYKIIDSLDEQFQENFSKLIEHVRTTFRELLSLDKVSFLFGTGSSICLGAPTIQNISDYLKSENTDKFKLNGNWAIQASKLVEEYDYSDKSVEDFLALLLDIKRLDDRGVKQKHKNIGKIITGLKDSICDECDVPSQSFKPDKMIGRLQETKAGFKDSHEDPLWIHKHFIRKILSRPTNLRRLNLFTVNYDLAFEKAMDQLGVVYIDGFLGGAKRYFRPHCYNHDYYYPQEKTEGNVHRLEEVLHLYKLHGSLNWIKTADHEPNSVNVYGIEQGDPKGNAEKVMIYPTPMKENEILGFPYTEMFRRFANAIQQPQSVLITYGYSFSDEQINRIIIEALSSIPSFHLLIVSYDMSGKIKSYYTSFKEDERISFILGDFLADWRVFVSRLQPDVRVSEVQEKISQSMRKYYEMQKLKNDTPSGKEEL